MINSSAKFIFVHGFLGLPSDWEQIQNYLRQKHQNQFQAVNLWSLASQGATLQELASKIAELCEPGSLVIGYSLGGRVLMHLPPDSFLKIAGMVLISSHFGFANSFDLAHSFDLENDEKKRSAAPSADVSVEKKSRLEQDQKWSQRFQNEEWSQVIKSWNDQPIFANSQDRPVRLQHNYDRKLLGQVMDQCSLGRQDNQINSLVIPWNKTLFLYGKHDAKYSELVKYWKTKQPKMAVGELSSGHDPLVISAQEVADRISTFYIKLMNAKHS